MKVSHYREDMALSFHVLISHLLGTRRHYAVSAIPEYYHSCCILHSPNILASWHRGPNGILTRGALIREEHCPCRFEIYYPYDLEKCPKILLVSRSSHSHPNPPPSKTPKPIIRVFHTLLDSLSWRLAATTPRRILLDSAFMNGLRGILSWPKDSIRDPSLADLHPSFANNDLTERLISTLRDECYPNGTGFEGKY